MNTDEFAHTKNVRRADSPCSCTGEKPCIHAACYGAIDPIWYCRHPLVSTPADAHAFKIPKPDNTVCDCYCSYPPGPPVHGIENLAQSFRSN